MEPKFSFIIWKGSIDPNPIKKPIEISFDENFSLAARLKNVCLQLKVLAEPSQLNPTR
jgi:hypothetical protein